MKFVVESQHARHLGPCTNPACRGVLKLEVFEWKEVKGGGLVRQYLYGCNTCKRQARRREPASDTQP